MHIFIVSGHQFKQYWPAVICSRDLIKCNVVEVRLVNHLCPQMT